MNQQNYNGTQQNQANAYRSSNPGTTGYGYAPMQQTQQSGVQYPYQQTQQKKSGGKLAVAIVAVILSTALIGFGGLALFRAGVNSTGTGSGSGSSGSGASAFAFNEVETPKTDTTVTGSGDLLTPAQVAAKVRPSIVSVVTVDNLSYMSQNSGEGSGIIIGSDGYIVTNSHVIGDSSKYDVSVITSDGTTYTAKVVGYDMRSDLAVLKIDATGLPECELGDSSQLVLGDYVVAIGNPGGRQFAGSVTLGIVSGVDRIIDTDDTESTSAMRYIQTDAAINPGNSGGALVDINGSVIGINSSKIGGSTVEGMGFAIPISRAIPIIEKLMSRETLSKVSEEEQGTIGISGATVTSSVSKAYNMPVGVYVAKIIEGGGAANSDLHEGDIITALNDQEITSMEDLQKLLQYYKAGTEVALTIQRQDGNGSYAEATVMVTLGTRASIQSADDQQESQEQGQDNGGQNGNGREQGGYGQGSQSQPDPYEGQQQDQEYFNPFDMFGFPFGN